MGEAPQTHRVTQILADGKFAVEGSSLAFGISPKQEVTVGQDIKGWLNEQGEWGPYIKVAQDRASSNGSGPSGGRSNPARDRSIERQCALKTAGYLAAAGRITPDAVTEYAGKFDSFLAASARSGGASSPPATPAAEPTGAPEVSGQGAAQPAPGLTDDINF